MAGPKKVPLARTPSRLPLAGMLLLVGTLCVWTGGCATQPHRAGQYREFWQSLPETDRQRLLGARIAEGDSREAVYIALGPPFKTEAIQGDEGATERWEYLVYAEADNPAEAAEATPSPEDAAHQAAPPAPAPANPPTPEPELPPRLRPSPRLITIFEAQWTSPFDTRERRLLTVDFCQNHVQAFTLWHDAQGRSRPAELPLFRVPPPPKPPAPTEPDE